jgi:hypothetical protein
MGGGCFVWLACVSGFVKISRLPIFWIVQDTAHLSSKAAVMQAFQEISQMVTVPIKLL